MEIPARVPVRSYPGLLEPGVVGFRRPILLLPADIQTRLTPHQLEAVGAHELCHVRRRDNLTSAMHMIVEAVFWFHPLVWWLGGRLVNERERACDEEVLRLGNEPQVYAEGILNVCKIYLESPLRCVSGVTGADLKERIHAIVAGRAAANLSFSRKAALVIAALTALTTPLVVGMIVNASPIRAYSQAPVETASMLAARNSLNQGVQAFRAQDYDSAIELFKKATELDPNMTNAYLYLATAYAQRYIPGTNSEENQKFANLAVESFQKALDLRPGDKTAVAGLAGIYHNSAQYDKAREAYLRNAELDPQNPIPFYAVGSVDWIIVHNTASTLSQGDRSRLIDEGLRYLDKAIALNPDYEDAYWYENLLLREEARILIEQANVTPDPREQMELLASAGELNARADDWSNRALEVRKKAKGLSAPHP
jgi:tetratricopeptide (TPR) repeat protein